MKCSRSTKAESEMFWIIILALVAIVVGILIIVFTKGGGVNTQLDNLGDYDQDGVSNMFDKCPCSAVGDAVEEGLQGCTLGTTPESAQADQAQFKDNACASN